MHSFNFAIVTAWALGLTSIMFGSTLIADDLFEELDQYVEQRLTEFDQIPIERQTQLNKLTSYIRARQASDLPVKMTFICTHNSRRSHMCQLWSAVAAHYFDVESYQSFSGGTEATAFNPRAVAALNRTGMNIELNQPGSNPVYVVRFSKASPVQSCFSKIYDSPPNPSSEFCAVMTCSSADKSCPEVQGAQLRVAIPYEDPKIADGTPEESQAYDNRSAQIAREMLYVFAQLKNDNSNVGK
ncbi:protein-tyrosine-phosphatase [Thalassoglobus sp. JC818]|uniref:protein-tyrosine-phosphatase n=1 Tax=Thalassoglobus sp. JC818 TaxID=3232136 RepID=UPI003459BF60